MTREIFSLILLLALLAGCAPASSAPGNDPIPDQASPSTPASVNQADIVSTSAFILTSPDIPADGRLPIDIHL